MSKSKTDPAAPKLTAARNWKYKTGVFEFMVDNESVAIATVDYASSMLKLKIEARADGYIYHNRKLLRRERERITGFVGGLWWADFGLDDD